MSVFLILIVGVFFWAGVILGQQSHRPVDDQPSDLLEKRFKMREEMHRRMMDKLLHGIGPDQDMFSDMEEMLTDSVTGKSQFKMLWLENRSGRTLEITPQSPDQKLDIDITNGSINIKGKSETKSQSGVSYSQFSNSFNVPGDCDSSRVKMEQKDGKILIQFPYVQPKKVAPKPQKDRVPIRPSDNDVQI